MVKGKGSMFGGVSDEQIESFIDTAAMMDSRTLKWILKAIKYLGSWAKPLTNLYNIIDKYTFGFGKHILLGIVAIIIYQSFLLWISLAKMFLSYFFGWYKNTEILTDAIKNASGSVIPGDLKSAGIVGSTAASALAGTGAGKVIGKVIEETVSDLAGKMSGSVSGASGSSSGSEGVSESVSEVKEEKEKKNRWGRKQNKKETKSTDGEAADSEFSF